MMRNHQDHQHHQELGSHESLILDLDAEVFGEHLSAVLEGAGVRNARRIVDLGAGTGAGSRMLRQRYPDAEVICVDNDPQMLAVLRRQGFVAVQADLENGFPALAEYWGAGESVPRRSVDFVWASSSIHHLGDPARLLTQTRRMLAPGGILAVVELAGLPTFFSQGSGRLLEERCHAAAIAEGWNQHPNWTTALEAAGFAVIESEVTTIATVTPAAREYARQWFSRFSRLEALTADERAALEVLAQGLPSELALDPRTSRTLWVATPTRTTN
ncbi:class I SAM-dependent methyltransferase [Arthrobacter cryoconiti]|uniref:Class I SAM-dependent methyltransferase n=1 Tax=Arthrobacter cryoconiti TaxID=748907 RepID=A0ABV8R143_9MICC|nr:class I SAM-dependent methyltransferase [Arthrobacter cryoconiti]MCC9068503.1 methyltransferase domain-containing protein [Arthrobacter cryoconiti]